MEQLTIEDVPFLRAKYVNHARMMKLVKWTKKYKRYNAYAVVREYEREFVWRVSGKRGKPLDMHYDVDLYCDKIKQ